MKANPRRIAVIAILIIVLFFLAEVVLRHKAFTQSIADLFYQAKRYSTAEKIFTRNGSKGDKIASANLAKSLYKQERYADATGPSADALAQDSIHSALNYDAGNIAYKQGDYQSALEHYRRALLQNPNDADTKANYELTMRKLQQQPPPPKQEENKDEKAQEDIRNILGGLDNKESSDRKQQRPNQDIPPDKWW